MGIKFFGQFLIEHGEVDAGQLREALDLMDRHNRSLGDLAVSQGLLSPQDASRVNTQQRYRDCPFGKLAAEMGLLDAGQVQTLVRQQQEGRLRIGEALVQTGALSDDRLGELLDRFKIDQAVYQQGLVELPPALSENRMAAVVVDLLPKMLMRVARIVGKVGFGHPVEGEPDFEHRISVGVSGVGGVRVSLLGDRDFAAQVAAATSMLESDGIGVELMEDGVGEFLNVLVGNAMGLLEREGQVMELEPPRRGVDISSGTVFEVAVSVGRAALVLDLL